MKDDEIGGMVKEWLTQTASYEWWRLKQDPYHQIEYFLTMNFLAKYMPEKGLILDAGGGPGRYAIELARRGYEVILFDLVPEMLKLAERKIRRAGLKRRVKQFVEGSVEDLLMFGDETFDAVLCLANIRFCDEPFGSVENASDCARLRQAFFLAIWCSNFSPHSQH